MIFNNTPQFSNFIQIQSIGYILYTNNRFWLMLTSIILLLAMIGPITLSISTKVNGIKEQGLAYLRRYYIDIAVFIALKRL